MSEESCKWCGCWPPDDRVQVGDLRYHPNCAVEFYEQREAKLREDADQLRSDLAAARAEVEAVPAWTRDPKVRAAVAKWLALPRPSRFAITNALTCEWPENHWDIAGRLLAALSPDPEEPSR